MGIDLCLKTDEGNNRVGQDIVNKYYDFMNAKEADYRPESIDYSSDTYREQSLNRLESEEKGVFICERWLSDIRQSGIELSTVFNEGDVISGGDILDCIDLLQEGKEEMKTEDQEKADFWEYYFELRLITLCEFAYENYYRIEYNY